MEASDPEYDRLTHKPVAILEEVSAWSGAPEGMPTVTVYDDGLVLRVSQDEAGAVQVTEGRNPSTKDVVANLARELGPLPPKTRLNQATDQPVTRILYRTQGKWRAVSVEGLHMKDGQAVAYGFGEERPADPRFVKAYRYLHEFPIEPTHPWVASDYQVTLWALEPIWENIVDWPAAVEPPPSNLVPNPNAMGKPRTYVVHDAALYGFVRAKGHRPTVRLPSGEIYDVWVNRRIPDQAYIDRINEASLRGTLP